MFRRIAHNLIGRARHWIMPNVSRTIMLAPLVGIVAGCGAIAFHWTCHLVMRYALGGVTGYSPAGPAGEAELFSGPIRQLVPWLLILVPTLGGLISGLLVYLVAPEAEGHGTDAAIDAYHNKRGAMRKRVPLIKMLASAVTIGTGGSG